MEGQNIVIAQARLVRRIVDDPIESAAHRIYADQAFPISGGPNHSCPVFDDAEDDRSLCVRPFLRPGEDVLVGNFGLPKGREDDPDKIGVAAHPKPAVTVLEKAKNAGPLALVAFRHRKDSRKSLAFPVQKKEALVERPDPKAARPVLEERGDVARFSVRIGLRIIA